MNVLVYKSNFELDSNIYELYIFIYLYIIATSQLIDLEISYCMQDFTGVPAVVDLACMRDAMNRLGSDSNKIDPCMQRHEPLFR